MEKKCSRCGEMKDYSCFNKDKSRKDGLQRTCRGCYKEYRLENRDRINRQQQGYKYGRRKELAEKERIRYHSNKEDIREKQKKYREDNRDKINKQKRDSYYRNKENILERNKEKYSNNRDFFLGKNRKQRASGKYKAYVRWYNKTRKRNDPLYKLTCHVRTMTYNAFRNKGYTKRSQTYRLLGCSFEDLKSHIENQFTGTMNWDNHGEWHIDHIVPLASAESEEQLTKLCHYSNLQPLWAEENLSKGGKEEWQRAGMEET